MSAKDFVIHAAEQAAQSPKVASGVAAGTTASGIGTVLNWIPDEIGKLATLVGIVLSVVLIYTHLKVGRMRYRKLQLEMDMLRHEHNQRQAETKYRRDHGLPNRRKDDQ